MIKLGVVTLLCLVGFFHSPVYAHVLIINDQSGNVGALFHVTPDDDPIAGPESTIYIDVQSQLISERSHFFDLTVTDPSGDKKNIPIKQADGYYSSLYVNSADKNSLIGVYTFPAKGTYRLELNAVAVNKETHNNHVLIYDQEVSRTAEEQKAQQYKNVALVALFWLFCALLIAVVFVAVKKDLQSKTR